MHPLLLRVPRLQMVAVFECAARLGSFTAAATELGMTQPAVSRQIAGLERATGQDLFDRSPNRVVPNAAGQTLLAAVQSGLDTIELALEEMNRGGPTFLIAANPGFAQRWLLPHLDELQVALGDADLRLRLFDRDTELTNDAFDVAIHLGAAAGAPAASRVLFEERVVPVIAPDAANELGLVGNLDPSRLIEVTKLHLDTRDRQWLGWAGWFRAHGVEWTASRARLSYNNYSLVMNDAMSGRGVALAWRGLVDALLDSGALVEVGPELHRPEYAYQVIPGPSAPPETVDRVVDWLLGLDATVAH